MTQTTVQPTITKVLDEVTMKRISITPKMSRYDKKGEYVSLAEQLQEEMYNRQALNHLRQIM